VCARDSASKALSANSRVYLSDSPWVKCSVYSGLRRSARLFAQLRQAKTPQTIAKAAQNPMLFEIACGTKLEVSGEKMDFRAYVEQGEYD
jgi:hypothetical protein